MAYMSQEKKKTLAPAIMALCKKHGVKATLSVSNHSSLVLTIKSGPFDFMANYNAVAAKKPREHSHLAKDSMQLNVYHYETMFSGKTLDFLKKLIPLMYVGNHDKSDIQSDYFNVGWYVDVNVGRWDKPYEVVKA
jgi:hypothetical protein